MEEKIRKLLKRYGASEKEIENFMNDLSEMKDEIEEEKADEIEETEEEDFNYLDADTIAKLKATEEGKDLILNAPNMAKEELVEAIKKYLEK